MYMVTVWNRESTNFNANAFVRVNGTDTPLIGGSEAQAFRIMDAAMLDAGIDRAIVESPNGRLTWERHQQDGSSACDGCCGNCNGCAENDDECDLGGCADAGHDPDTDNECDYGGCPDDDDDVDLNDSGM